MKKLLICLTVLCLGFPLFGKTVVLYHTSDVHGFFYPQKGIGGFGALGGVLEKEKAPYLLLDSGDFANGTAETKQTKGLTAVELMNSIGYDAATVGNHEFDFKDEGIAPLLQKAKFAVVAANLREKATDKLPAWAKPFELFQVGDAKVAVIGLANRTPTNPTKTYYFTKPLEALSQALEQLQPVRPDVTVVLVHDSLKDYKAGALPYMGEMAENFGGKIHVVLGGHAHAIFQNEFINNVLYAESGCYLKNVTKITVEIDDETGKVSSHSELIKLDIAKTGENKQIVAKAEGFKVPGMDEVIGYATVGLSKNPVRKHEADSPLNNWISDMGRAYTQTDVFIHNTGGTRVSVEPGDITRRTLIDLFPFDDAIMSFSITGRELKNFIRRGLVPWVKYAFSGLDISYRLNKKGQVKNLQVRLNGKPVENKATYTVGTNSYVARQFEKYNPQVVGTTPMRTLIEQNFKKGILSAPQTGRMIQK